MFDYLPADTLIVVDTGVEEAAERFHGEVRERHESLRHDRERPLCTPAEVFIAPNEVFAAVKAHPSIMVLGPLAERTGRRFGARHPTASHAAYRSACGGPARARETFSRDL